MGREKGYYWCKFFDYWEIFHYEDGLFFLDGVEYRESEFDEIDERIIKRDDSINNNVTTDINTKENIVLTKKDLSPSNENNLFEHVSIYDFKDEVLSTDDILNAKSIVYIDKCKIKVLKYKQS